jgi:hypothetical protein
MSYVHYRHENKRWYYWVDNRDSKFYDVNHKKHWNHSDETEFAYMGCTRSEAKSILNKIFDPLNYTIIEGVPFHQSNSYYLSSCKHRGSREKLLRK